MLCNLSLCLFRLIIQKQVVDLSLFEGAVFQSNILKALVLCRRLLELQTPCNVKQEA